MTIRPATLEETCQYFVNGSQATGIDKDACTKPATCRVLDFAMYALSNPVMCGRHALFWKRRGYQVIALDPADGGFCLFPLSCLKASGSRLKTRKCQESR